MSGDVLPSAGELDDPGDTVVRAVFSDRAATVRSYAALLANRGVEWGMIGPREVPRIWSRHLLNSAAIAPLVPPGASVVDVGSGAGLPGIPLALARPDLSITLLEPLERRFEFLRLAIEQLGLADRVGCLRARAEDVRGDTWDVVTCRAVAPLGRLLAWTSRLYGPGGMLVALKGSSAEEEVRKNARELGKAGLRAEVLVVRAHPDAEPTRAIKVVRTT